MKETKENRRCLHCNNEIENSHGSRRFCVNTIATDGSINSCKDDFHNAKKKPRYEMIKRIAKIQLLHFDILHRFFISGKKIVSSEELEKAGMKLHFCIMRMKIPNTNEYGLYFIDYLLKGSDTKQLTIIKHDYKF